MWCNAMQRNAMNLMRGDATEYSAMQCNAMQCTVLQENAMSCYECVYVM